MEGKEDDRGKEINLLVFPQLYGDKSLVPTSDITGQMWGTMRKQSARRRRPSFNTNIPRRIFGLFGWLIWFGEEGHLYASS